ncbi:MAG: hypothetical protein LBG74_03370, partial [Spirochaetaceae bacterium]|nr:hypothetical protein [Spirochaetaceae bacterium]
MKNQRKLFMVTMAALGAAIVLFSAACRKGVMDPPGQDNPDEDGILLVTGEAKISPPRMLLFIG